MPVKKGVLALEEHLKALWKYEKRIAFHFVTGRRAERVSLTLSTSC